MPAREPMLPPMIATMNRVFSGILNALFFAFLLSDHIR